MSGIKTVKHSAEWWEGYSCHGPKCHNPYLPVTSTEYEQWEEGWLARFYGEEP